MYMRFAGCVAGILGVLGYEAATAAVHPTLNLKSSVPASDPLVALSEGVLATPAAPAEHQDRTWTLVVPKQQATSQPCSVAAVACGQPGKQDAGVAPVSASTSACQGTGPG